MIKKHMERYSTQLIIKEIQINTTVRYHLTLVRMAISEKSKDNKHWKGCGEKGTLPLLVEMYMVTVTVRTVWRFPKN